MRMEQYFDRPDSCYFVPDPEWAASYSRENWEKRLSIFCVSRMKYVKIPSCLIWTGIWKEPVNP